MAIAGVWLYHGVWNKLLAPAGRHAEIVASGPALLEISPRVMLVAIGTLETLLALWVLARLQPRWCAIVQTLLLVGMNVSGLVWARHQIADPGAMIVQNIAFLTLVWSLALAPSAMQQHD